MPMPLRVPLSLGLALLVVMTRPAPSLGQNAGAGAAEARSSSPASLRIGAIDMEQVFKEYKKVEFTRNQLQTDAQAKQAELAKMLSQMQQLGEEMKGLAPGSNTFTEKENQITQLRAQLEAQREQAEAEFARREAEALAQIYREVQDASAAVAKANNMQYIVKVSKEPVTGSDLNSVMSAMARSVIYSDPSLDITPIVIKYLNQRYEASGGASAAPADPATQPASAPAPGTSSATPSAAPATRGR